MYPKRNKELEVISLYRGGYKAEFYLRQISKLSKLPLKTCQTILGRLEKNKILKSKEEGKNKYFSLNLENVLTKSYLLQAEIYQAEVFIDKYPQVKLFLKSIAENTPIIVFGSFAKLTAEKDSDLDLLIISKQANNLPFHLLPFNVHQVNLTEATFLKALRQGESLIKEVEDNHIILENHSFYVNTMWRHYCE